MGERVPPGPNTGTVNIEGGGILNVIQQNSFGSGNISNNQEAAPFLNAAVSKRQQRNTEKKQEKTQKQKTKEDDSKKMNLMSVTPTSESETLAITGFEIKGEDLIVSCRTVRK